MLNCIVAMDRNRVIGFENRLPWRLSGDLKRFKEITGGHHVIMGRKTYESIGKPLPGRTNIVITRQRDFAALGCRVVHSLEDALASTSNDREVFILGGAEIFEQAIELADRIYVTRVDAAVKGDTYFPEIRPEEWEEGKSERHPADERNEFPYAFVTYVRRKASVLNEESYGR